MLRPSGRVLFYCSLPAKMRKCFVGLRHLVHFVAFADGVSLPLVGIDDLGRQRFLHRNALPPVRHTDQPPHPHRDFPAGAHFHPPLLRAPANPPRFPPHPPLHTAHRPPPHSP